MGSGALMRTEDGKTSKRSPLDAVRRDRTFGWGNPKLRGTVAKVAISPSYWLATASVLFSGLLGGKVTAALLVGLCAVLGGLFGRKTPLGRAMTGPVCAMSLGVLVASQSPAPAAVLRRLQFFSVTLATPLLLLSCNLKELCGPATRRLLGAFAVGAVSTASAALLAALVLRHPLSAALGGWETASKAIAALTSKNIGSGINFVAVAQALQMKPLIIAASLAVDSALGVIYFPVAASLTPKNSESRGRGATLEEQGRGPEHFSLTESLTTFLVALAIAFLAHQFSPAGYACITSSLLAVLLGTFPAAKRWPAGEALGWPLLPPGGGQDGSDVGGGTLHASPAFVPNPEHVTAGVLWIQGFAARRERADEHARTRLRYLYFAAAGFTAVPGSTLRRFSPLIDFGIMLYAIHLLLILLLGRLAKLTRAELLVASSANIGGPATASSLASSKQWPQLQRPALLVGTFGNAVAGGLGLAIFHLLRRLPH
ncbi:unnamed protein product [Durusdinium trenchii]|uniref:DUF819 family protein n=1 Tax=Durusdinium trenchii TaxID=1381693 RepID=A0ABP0SMF1_9DINO